MGGLIAQSSCVYSKAREVHFTMDAKALTQAVHARRCEEEIAGKIFSVTRKVLTVAATMQPKDSGAPKTGDMMMGRPVAKFYEAVTTTEQTLF